MPYKGFFKIDNQSTAKILAFTRIFRKILMKNLIDSCHSITPHRRIHFLGKTC